MQHCCAAVRYWNLALQYAGGLQREKSVNQHLCTAVETHVKRCKFGVATDRGFELVNQRAESGVLLMPQDERMRKGVGERAYADLQRAPSLISVVACKAMA